MSKTMEVSIDCLQEYDVNYIQAKYEEVIKTQKQYALIQVNVKNFRYFNSKYGYEAGDEILALILQRLKETLEKDEYVARLYADNFVMLLRYDDVETLVYERLFSLIDFAYRIEDDRVYRNLFYSFGIYLLEDKLVKFQDALNSANLCRKECDTLFNRSSSLEIYETSFYDRYMQRMKLEVDTANAYKQYEFTFHLQAKVDLKSETICGAEALLRWIDKDGNAIPVQQFLPILNQNNYIKLVDLDLFEQVCTYLDSRIKAGLPIVPISFNISKANFYTENILQEYVRIFEQFSIPKEYIEMEFMESISLNDMQYMREVITKFKQYGFHCSLDDFGNGYSSFNVLLNAPLDTVKMDRQFFLNNLNGNSELVIKTVIDLIHSLNMSVVAEGVEDEAHIRFLKQCNCDYVQGFYYYKPIAVEAFSALLDK